MGTQLATSTSRQKKTKNRTAHKKNKLKNPKVETKKKT